MKGRDAPAGTGATTPDRNKGKFFGGMLGQAKGEKREKHPNTFRASARGKLGDAALPAHSGVSASVGFPAVDGAGLR